MATHKAIALCRVSTSKQRIEGSSLQAQEVSVNDCAAYLDAEIKQLWSLDTSSRKGKNLARKDLREMKEYCRKNRTIRYIIVDEADRFMRSMKEAYWWKVEFEQMGVYLAYANMPEITHEEDPMAVMREMMGFFQAEMSNHERITKTTDKMQAKIKAGYYPGMVHTGYRKSDVPGLHVPREPHWSLLKEAIRGILDNGWSLSEALKWLNDNGYRLQGGRELDMHRFKQILQEPYYAGIVRMGNWDVECEHGLHKAMITKEEHERLVAIVAGKRKKFTVKKFNPMFPASNIVECADCTTEGRSDARLVGYRHHNGKPERTRRFYDRYRCRGCNKNLLKEQVHSSVSGVLERTELIIDDAGMFQDAMRKAWQADVGDNLQAARRLKQKLTSLNQEKDNLVRAIANNPGLASDFESSLTTIKTEIAGVEQEIRVAEDIDKDFEEFMRFSLDYAEHLKDNWWDAEDPEERIRFKELAYTDGLAVFRSGKVRTPQLSPIFRYKTSKKTPGDVNFGSKTTTGGPSGTRTQDTLLKRQVL